MKYFLYTVLGVAALVGIGYFMGGGTSGAPQNNAPAGNVSVQGGTQIIEIRAKGGYQPRTSIAKAGVPTILRFVTKGTFDCSASIRIPSLGISQILPQSGSTDVAVNNPSVGTLQGTCGMGMYPFSVDFKG